MRYKIPGSMILIISLAALYSCSATSKSAARTEEKRTEHVQVKLAEQEQTVTQTREQADTFVYSTPQSASVQFQVQSNDLSPVDQLVSSGNLFLRVTGKPVIKEGKHMGLDIRADAYADSQKIPVVVDRLVTESTSRRTDLQSNQEISASINMKQRVVTRSPMKMLGFILAWYILVFIIFFSYYQIKRKRDKIAKAAELPWAEEVKED